MPLEENSKKDEIVLLSHGAGGLLQEKLIKFITNGAKLREVNRGVGLDAFDDGATIPINNSEIEIVVTSDGHTITPIFFPGGDLGKLGATGTINDLLMMGADPVAISSTVFIEEGMKFETLEKIFFSFNETLDDNGIALLCGDTKVLPKGNLDKIIMATTGIGIRPKGKKIEDSNLKPGNKIIITGTIGDHGASLIANRKEIDIQTKLISDVAVLRPIIDVIKDLNGINAMKDPTRGGIASALNHWAEMSEVSIILEEEKIPIKKEVKAISEILGLDPLNISCEGRALIAVESKQAEIILEKIKAIELGKEARIIGEVHSENSGQVLMKTKFGGTRFIDMPMGEPIPRVC